MPPKKVTAPGNTANPQATPPSVTAGTGRSPPQPPHTTPRGRGNVPPSGPSPSQGQHQSPQTAHIMGGAPHGRGPQTSSRPLVPGGPSPVEETAEQTPRGRGSGTGRGRSSSRGRVSSRSRGPPYGLTPGRLAMMRREAERIGNLSVQEGRWGTCGTCRRPREVGHLRSNLGCDWCPSTNPDDRPSIEERQWCFAKGHHVERREQFPYAFTDDELPFCRTCVHNHHSGEAVIGEEQWGQVRKWQTEAGLPVAPYPALPVSRISSFGTQVAPPRSALPSAAAVFFECDDCDTNRPNRLVRRIQGRMVCVYCIGQSQYSSTPANDQIVWCEQGHETSSTGMGGFLQGDCTYCSDVFGGAGPNIGRGTAFRTPRSVNPPSWGPTGRHTEGLQPPSGPPRQAQRPPPSLYTSPQRQVEETALQHRFSPHRVGAPQPAPVSGPSRPPLGQTGTKRSSHLNFDEGPPRKKSRTDTEEDDHDEEGSDEDE